MASILSVQVLRPASLNITSICTHVHHITVASRISVEVAYMAIADNFQGIGASLDKSILTADEQGPSTLKVKIMLTELPNNMAVPARPEGHTKARQIQALGKYLHSAAFIICASSAQLAILTSTNITISTAKGLLFLLPRARHPLILTSVP